MSAPQKFVCWEPVEDDAPELITAASPEDAAKLHVLRSQAKATTHDNGWSPSAVLVVDYETGESACFTVKVRVDLHGEDAEP